MAAGKPLDEYQAETVNASTVLALDLATGKTRWQRPIGGPLAPPAIGDGTIFVAGRRSGQIFALDSEDGGTVWTREIPDVETLTPPVFSEGLLYVQGERVMHALDPDSGETVWSRGALSSEAVPAVDAGSVYTSLFGHREPPTVKAQNRLTGASLWTYDPVSTCCYGYEGSTVVVGGSTVYARGDATPDNGVTLSAQTGSPIGTFSSEVPPVVAGNVLLVMNYGVIEAEDATTGASLWSFEGDNTLRLQPLVVGETVYVASGSGRLYGLDLQTGEIVWRGVSEIHFSYLDERSGLGAGNGVLVVPGYNGISAWAKTPTGDEPGPGRDAFPGAADQTAALPPMAPEEGQTVDVGFDAAESGFLNIDSPAPPLEVRWSKDIAPADIDFRKEGSQPLIVDDAVFLAASVNEQIRIEARNLESGELLWEHKEAGLRLAIAYDEGAILARTENGEQKGELIALEAADGSVRWRASLGLTRGETSMAARDGSTVVSTDDGDLSAFSSATGSKIWSRSGSEDSALPLTIADGRVYSSTLEGNFALDLETGAPVWTNTPFYLRTGARHQTFSNGRLFDITNETGSISAASNGEFQDGFYSETAPAVAGDIAVLTSDSDIFAQDVADGRVLWSERAGDEDWEEGYASNSRPAIVGRTVYRPAHGVLYAHDLATGEGVWAGRFAPALDPTDDIDAATGVSAGNGALATVDGNRLVVFEEAGADHASPQTRLLSGPRRIHTQQTAVFEFEGTGDGFECMVGNQAWIRCDSGRYEKYVGGQGRYLFRVRAVTDEGAVDPSPEFVEWIFYRPIPPNKPRLTKTPPAVTDSNDARFEFSSIEAGIEHRCELDGRASVCESPYTVTGLERGEHEFSVVAERPDGVSSAPATHRWTIENKPRVQITSGPTAGETTKHNTATIEFSSTESDVEFRCALDDGETQSCESPFETGALADGDHEFRLIGVKPGGTESDTATRKWSVDTVPPSLEWIKTPPSETNDPGASFEFESEPGATVTCQLDEGAESACNTPLEYAGLAHGQHVLRVTATDIAGNEAQEEHSWLIDLVAPRTTFTKTPRAKSRSRSAKFRFVSDEPGSTFECSLDGAQYASCEPPVLFDRLRPGRHEFGVRATDRVGNLESEPSEYCFRVQRGSGGARRAHARLGSLMERVGLAMSSERAAP